LYVGRLIIIVDLFTSTRVLEPLAKNHRSSVKVLVAYSSDICLIGAQFCYGRCELSGHALAHYSLQCYINAHFELYIGSNVFIGWQPLKRERERERERERVYKA